MKKIIAIAALAFIANVAGAQKTITFESKSKGKTHHSHKRHKRETGKNSLSIGLVQLLDGYLPVMYERRLNDRISIAVGAGPTFHPYYTDLGLAIYDEGSSTGSYEVDNKYYSYKYRTVQPGFGFTISPRFYSEDAMDGVYFSPTFEYKHFRFQSQKANETLSFGSPSGYNSDELPHTPATVAESMSCYDLIAIVGGQYQLRGHLGMGWYVGIGARYRSQERLDYGYSGDGSGNYHLTNEMRSYSGARVLFSFGLSLGGWW